MESYTLGLFSNMYPAFEGDLNGIFIWRMVQKLESRGIIIKKAVKESSKNLGYFPFYAKSLKLSLDSSLDLLQAHYIPHSSLIPSLLKGKKPLIIKFHGDDARIYPYKNSLNRSLIRSMLKRADHVLTSSEEMRRGLLTLGGKGEKITALSSGVDTSKYIPQDQRESRKLLGLPCGETLIFLFVGRLHNWKGIHEIIEAASVFRDSLFIFVGPGKIPDHPENCRFIGSIPHQMIKTWINAADICLLPSYTEGLSNFLMESLSCAKAVIASDIGGNPEVVNHMHTGFLIPPCNVDALSEAIGWMKNHPQERSAMGSAGRLDMIARYDEDILIDRLVGIHRMLIDR